MDEVLRLALEYEAYDYGDEGPKDNNQRGRLRVLAENEKPMDDSKRVLEIVKAENETVMSGFRKAQRRNTAIEERNAELTWELQWL